MLLYETMNVFFCFDPFSVRDSLEEIVSIVQLTQEDPIVSCFLMEKKIFQIRSDQETISFMKVTAIIIHLET